MAKKKDDKPEPRTCGSCNGSGQLSQQMTKPDGSKFIHYRTCPTCGGSGKVW